MIRGTTPVLQFNLPFNAEGIDVLFISFMQNGNLVFEKNKADCEMHSNMISCQLSQADTLQFNDKGTVEIQIRIRKGEEALASNIITADVGRILKDGQI